MATTDGILLQEEIEKLPGWPGETYIEKKGVAVLECVEDIPCNPCEAICPVHAIGVGKPITNLPSIDGEKCTGCKLCVAVCPGLAIFVINKNFSKDLAAVSLPYELLPLPHEGDIVHALDRKGVVVCSGEVVEVAQRKKYDRTAVVTVTIPKKWVHGVRNIKIIREHEHE
jgi:Fe-S-cluster-containing hydrogenase component 2